MLTLWLDVTGVIVYREIGLFRELWLDEYTPLTKNWGTTFNVSSHVSRAPKSILSVLIVKLGISFNILLIKLESMKSSSPNQTNRFSWLLFLLPLKPG